MVYTSGTATDYKDLLAILYTFVTANGWTGLESSTDAIFLKGTGLSGLDEIFVGIETYEDVANSRYNWSLTGAWGYRSGRDYSSMPNNSQTSGICAAYLWNSSIPYWIVCTGRFVVVVAKVSTVYEMVGFGLQNVIGTDAQYPYPLFIGGTGTSLTANYSLATTAHSSFWNASANGVGIGRLCDLNGTWSITGGTTNSSDAKNVIDLFFNDRDNIVTSPTGEYLLWPIFISNTSNRICYGYFDQIFKISGYNQTAENIVTIDAVDYLVVPDTFRSTYGDYCAVRLS